MTGSALDTRWLQVLRLSPAVATRLEAAPPEAGRVHSVFTRAVNLSWHDGGLVTLQAPGALAAPFAAALARMPAADAIHPGGRVGRRGDALVLEGVGVRWRGATLANTAVRESPGSPPPALETLMDECRGQSARALGSPIGQRARSHLAEGLKRRHVATFLDGAFGLIGLGEGLTPAGDDCLVGALAVIQRFDGSWLAAHPEIRASLRQRAWDGTTVVAREFIVHALSGHFAESVIDLLEADSVGAARRGATRLLGVGATSGSDTLLGIRLALAALGSGGRSGMTAVTLVRKSAQPHLQGRSLRARGRRRLRIVNLADGVLEVCRDPEPDASGKGALLAPHQAVCGRGTGGVVSG